MNACSHLVIVWHEVVFVALTILIAVLAGCGLLMILWAIAEALLTPIPRDSLHIVNLRGRTAEVQQRMRTCLWLRERGMRGRLLFVDRGMEPEAQIAAQMILHEHSDAALCHPAQICEYIETENEKLGTGAD